MSYSFSIRAACVTAAAAAVSTELDKVVEAQPIHAADRHQAESAVATFLNLVGEPPEGQELAVSVGGYVCKDDGALISANVAVTVRYLLVDCPY